MLAVPPALGIFLWILIMEHQGWISLHRKIQDNILWKDGRVFSRAEAWIDILMEVQHDKKKSKTMIGNVIIECGRGQSIKSISTWADRWKWSRSAIQRYFVFLKRHTMITTENLTKTIRITVCNYDTYQNKRIDVESDLNRTRIEPESMLDTDNNGNKANNEKNDKNKEVFPEGLNVNEFIFAWQEWTKYRIERKKKLTPSTITKQLKKLSQYPLSTAISAINESILNGWIGLFPEKGNENGRKTGKTGQRQFEKPTASGSGNDSGNSEVAGIR